ncbi:MAG: nucleotidyl transferase AbiEii/AbiGii toxin family protein [Acidimicrobiales bacterium]
MRLEVTRGEDRSELDLGYDSRIRPEELTSFGPVVATEELAADKTLALFGRAAARDFVDVYILARRFGEEKLCELAAEKDAGFDRAHLGDALRSFRRLDRDLFEVDDETYDKMARWSLVWAHDLDQEIARERGLGIESGRSLDEGPDLPDF